MIPSNAIGRFLAVHSRRPIVALPSRVFRSLLRSLATALALPLLFAAPMLGCGSGTSVGGGSSQAVSSSGIASEDLEANISVVATAPDHVYVGASFIYDSILTGVDDVELASGDSVRVSLAGRSRTLARDPDVTSPHYETTFDISPAEGQVQVRFRGSSFTLPLRPAFTVTSPTPGLALGFQDHLDLEWTPADPGGVIQIWLSRSCKTLAGGTRGGSSYLQVLDDGAHSYDLGLLPEATDPDIDITQDCTLDLRFVREASATVSPPLSSFSHLDSTQSRAVGGMTISF